VHNRRLRAFLISWRRWQAELAYAGAIAAGTIRRDFCLELLAEGMAA
jgi:hypothetical protein